MSNFKMGESVKLNKKVLTVKYLLESNLTKEDISNVLNNFDKELTVERVHDFDSEYKYELSASDLQNVLFSDSELILDIENNKLLVTLTSETSLKINIESNIEEFESVKDGTAKMAKDTYRYYQSGRVITCVLTDTLGNKGIGIAKCNSKDVFNRGNGILLAEARAKADIYNNIAKRIVAEVL